MHSKFPIEFIFCGTLFYENDYLEITVNAII